MRLALARGSSPIFYFKYGFLNCLRDELYLTFTYQKFTLTHLLRLIFPAAGFGVGIGVGKAAHSWATGIAAVTIGCGIGLLGAWLIPRLLWSMLRLFVRKGWFLLPESPQNEGRCAAPPMTRAEFAARSEAFDRKDSRQIFIIVPIILGIALGMSWLAFYIDRVKPAQWVQGLAGIGFVSVFIGLFVWPFRVKKRLWRKHGLLCPACGRKITDIAGMIRVPAMGLCKHCGTKIVTVADQDSSPR
jgi:hypothetical protein